MTTEARGALIGLIIGNMRLIAHRQKRPFDGGDLFFSLAFRTDDELRSIAKAAGI